MAKRKTWIKRLHQGLQQRKGRDPLAAEAPRQRLVFESLEPRLLLSDSPLPLPVFAAGGTLSINLHSGDLKVETVYSGGTPQIRVWDNFSNSSLGQLAFNQNIRVNISGLPAIGDKVTVDLGYDDGNAGGSNPVSAFALMVALDGGTDVPLVSDDTLTLASSGPDVYNASALFLRSSDDIQVNSAVQVSGHLGFESNEKVAVNGVALRAADIYLGVDKAVTDGVTLLDGFNLLGNATGSITLNNATLQAASIGLIVATSVDVDTRDASYASNLIKVATTQTQSNAAVSVMGSSSLSATAGALTLRATSTLTARTLTQPDGSSNQSDKDASIALAILSSDAAVSVAGTSSLSATGALTVAAANTVNATTRADGGAGSSSGSAVGGTVAGTVLGGDTRVSINNTASLAGGTLSLSAIANRTVDTQARSTQGGATSGGSQTTGQQKLQQQNAGTSDGSLQLAAAVAFSNLSGDSEVLVATGGTLSSGGALAIDAASTLAGPVGGVMTLADGSNTQAGATGIGVGAAINTANVASRVQFSGATTLTAPGGVTALASLTSTRFGAQATAGAGGSNVGVAGALAAVDFHVFQPLKVLGDADTAIGLVHLEATVRATGKRVVEPGEVHLCSTSTSKVWCSASATPPTPGSTRWRCAASSRTPSSRPAGRAQRGPASPSTKRRSAGSKLASRGVWQRCSTSSSGRWPGSSACSRWADASGVTGSSRQCTCSTGTRTRGAARSARKVSRSSQRTGSQG